MKRTLKALKTYCYKEWRRSPEMATVRVVNPGELQFCDGRIDVHLYRKGVQGPQDKAAPLEPLMKGFDKLDIDDEGEAFIEGDDMALLVEAEQWHGQELKVGPWDDAHAITDTRWMKAAVEMLAPAMANEEARYYLNAIAIDDHDIVAVNGRILATLATPVKLYDNVKPFLIWRNAVPVIKAMINDFDLPEAVFYDMTDNNMCLVFDGAELTIRTIENHHYPDWRRVIPYDAPLRGKVQADVFVKACRQLKKMGARSVTWANGRLMARLPEGKISVDMSGIRDDALIRLVPEEAIALLAPLKKRTVRLYQKDPSSPIRFEVMEPVEAGKWTGVAMPARF